MNGDQKTNQPAADEPAEAKPAAEKSIKTVETADAPTTATADTTPVTPETAAPDETPEPTEPAKTVTPASDTSVDKPAQPPEQHFFTAEEPAVTPAEPAATIPVAATPAAPDQIHDEQPLEWNSADTPAHPKPAGWLGMVTGGAVLLAAIIYLFTHDLFSAISIVVAAGVLVIFNARKSHAVHYRLDRGGIVIGQKFYAYDQFRSFMADTESSPAGNIVLMPLQRFMPPIMVICDHSIENEVIGHISAHLPMEPYQRDPVDTLLHRLHF